MPEVGVWGYLLYGPAIAGSEKTIAVQGASHLAAPADNSVAQALDGPSQAREPVRLRLANTPRPEASRPTHRQRPPVSNRAEEVVSEDQAVPRTPGRR